METRERPGIIQTVTKPEKNKTRQIQSYVLLWLKKVNTHEYGPVNRLKGYSFSIVLKTCLE